MSGFIFNKMTCRAKGKHDNLFSRFLPCMGILIQWNKYEIAGYNRNPNFRLQIYFSGMMANLETAF